MTEPRRRKFDDLLAGGAAAPRPRRFDHLLAERQPTLEEIDADRAAAREQSFRPVSELEQDPAWAAQHFTSAPSAGAPVWSGGSTLSDAAYAAAGGAFSGLGINPRQAFGDEVGGRLQIANERSPIAAPIGQMVGEIGIQAAALPARGSAAALGAMGGFLSGVGNADTDSWTERGTAGLGGAAIGMGAGYAGGKIVDALAAPGRKLAAAVPDLEREAVSQQLMHGGATRGDLKQLDKLGGRAMYADRARELGITGKPAAVEAAARDVVDAADAGRTGILAQVGPLDVDRAALGAGIRRSNPYPGITNMDNAVERAAVDAEALGRGAAAPWDDVNRQRQYWGNKTNFASGTPEAAARKGIYGAFNNELEDAINLAQPGLGDAWRGLGRDESVGIKLGDIATAARDRARDRPWHFGDVATFGATRMIDANKHAVGEKLARAGATAGRAIGAVDDFAGQLGLAPANLAGLAAGSIGGERGAEHAATQAALDDLSNGGQALGKYAGPIAQAAASPAPGAVTALIQQLAAEDEEFRSRVLPMLTRGG